ncbi:Lon protease [Gammaproteobacteria bacterium]
MAEINMHRTQEKQNSIPILPLRDSVIYPFMVVPLFINRPKSIQALETSVNTGKQIFFVAQKDAKNEDPKFDDLYHIGTMANVLQVLKLPDGTIKVLAEGISRGKIKNLVVNENLLIGEIEALEDTILKDNETEALIRSLLDEFSNFVKLNSKIPPEILSALANINEPGRLADAVAAHLPLIKFEDKQKILEIQDAKQRLQFVIGLLVHELEVLQVEEKLKHRVKTQLDKTQREFYLNEKLKAVQKELDEISEGRQPLSEAEKLKARIEKAGLSKEAKEKALAEFNKLKMMPPMSAEATVSRNYLDWLLDIPWKKMTKVNKSLPKAEKILEVGHYGLEKIKERIIEYLAVQNRVRKIKGPILCLVGPPGVGKTSLGQSIAHATGRELIRVSLGGVRDEAEIRGHRRTYIGALPGKILQKMAKVKVRNPLFMLDEVDKMAMDFRGDPASALLEVLDPEQNHAFNDHYLEVDYDLSDVMFIATANSLDIPPALLDRMEVLRLAGYTEDEKLRIAMQYLIPKQIKESGLKSKEIVFAESAIVEIIRYYTREAGVRNLEREIAKICRKVVKDILINPKSKKVEVTEHRIEKYLGVKIYHFGLAENKDQVGQVTGLAWTEVGGDLLTIEVAVVPGKGKAIYTGRLGEIMQESIHAALTVVRSRSQALGIEKDFYEKCDLHVHVPEGATPKDGPSAGIGMCTALVSALTHIPVRADVAMTGEITLRGEVLQIGGLKEKLLAALRGGIKTVIIPEENIKDLKEMPKNITEYLIIKPVKWIDQVLEIALKHKPQVLKVKSGCKKTKKSRKK